MYHSSITQLKAKTKNKQHERQHNVWYYLENVFGGVRERERANATQHLIIRNIRRIWILYRLWNVRYLSLIVYCRREYLVYHFRFYSLLFCRRKTIVQSFLGYYFCIVWHLLLFCVFCLLHSSLNQLKILANFFNCVKVAPLLHNRLFTFVIVIVCGSVVIFIHWTAYCCRQGFVSRHLFQLCEMFS